MADAGDEGGTVLCLAVDPLLEAMAAQGAPVD
jgi:hypothetical protein